LSAAALASLDFESESELVDSLLEDDFFAPPLAAWRSFFAHPEPLKTIAGGANALRIVPSAPHDGQNFGPLSLIPWRMSVRWPQALQWYS
jgi:hypothetical protein